MQAVEMVGEQRPGVVARRDGEQPADELHIWSGLSEAADAKRWVEWHIESARSDVAALQAVTGDRTVENTLVP